jgi:PAS domain S-box-containing protein
MTADILLVNDREDQLLALEIALSPITHNIIKARSGRETLDILSRDNDFAAILLDVKMPIMDGFETAAIIRQCKKTETIPIIFVTAVELSLANQFTGYALGAVDYIVSPFEPEILRAKVKAFLMLYDKRKQILLQAESLAKINKKLKEEIKKRKAIEVILQSKNMELKREINQRIETEQALSQSEEKFRQLAENIQEVFWIASLDFKKFIYVSNLYEKVWGRTLQDLYEQPEIWFESVTVEYRQQVLNAFLKLGKDQSPIAIEYKILRLDGTIRWIYNRGFQILSKSGEPYRLTGLATDITERKKLEDIAFHHKYHLKLAELDRVNSMGEMASSLAHEFNQPLTAVITYTQTCIRKLKDSKCIGEKESSDSYEEILQAMKVVAEQAERAGQILHRMKDFVRKGDLLLECLNINDIILKLMPLIRYEARDTNTVVELQHADSLPLLFLDRIQIEQVILNLVRNAVEAMSEAKTTNPHLIVRTELQSKSTVIVSIIDNGPGLPNEDFSTLFKPYITSKKMGTGMGLAISRTIVEAHGGKLSASHNLKGGACFSMILNVSCQ